MALPCPDVTKSVKMKYPLLNHVVFSILCQLNQCSSAFICVQILKRSKSVRRILNNKQVFVQAEPELVEGVAVYTASAFDKLRRRLFVFES